MANKIPGTVYRGDEDKYNVRSLKSTLHLGQLQTPLLSGGDGHIIFDTPLLDLVGNHVFPSWAKTHFLSFSEDRTTALAYGLHCDYSDVPVHLMQFEEYYEEQDGWTFAVFNFDLSQIDWQQQSEGIFTGEFEPSLKKFKVYPGKAKVILIDVVTAINQYSNHPYFTKIIENGVRDKEWLLLPATNVKLNTGAIEYSGILDGKYITEITRYKRIG